MTNNSSATFSGASIMLGGRTTTLSAGTLNCGLFAQAYPRALPVILETLDFNTNNLNNLLAGFARVDLPVGTWNEGRSAYLSKLISARREALRKALGV